MTILILERSETSQLERVRKQEHLALQRYMEHMATREKTIIMLQTNTPLEVDTPERVASRKSMLGPKDYQALERIIGKSDLVLLNFLEKGLLAGKSICRIEAQDEQGNTFYGTGFLISPSLLLTNNHVIPDVETACRVSAQFNYELDIDNQERTRQDFILQPDQLFITNADLDFTLVAIHNTSASGVRIQEFGFLPLVKQTGKILLGEYVSIIQHPEGHHKSVNGTLATLYLSTISVRTTSCITFNSLYGVIINNFLYPSDMANTRFVMKECIITFLRVCVPRAFVLKKVSM